MSGRGQWVGYLKGYPAPVTHTSTGKLKRYIRGRTGAATSVIIPLALLINDGEDELIAMGWMNDVTSEIHLHGC